MSPIVVLVLLINNLDLHGKMISLFEKLSLEDVDKSSGVFKLPPELLTLVLKSPVLLRPDLLPCLMVCKRWHPVAKAVLYEHLLITERIDTQLFSFCFQNYDLGQYVTKLTITDRWKNSPKKSPFLGSRFTNILLSYCHNIVSIRATEMNPYYLLRSLESDTLPNLEKIDICWRTCQKSPSVIRWFYTANYHHKGTIKYLNMPYRSSGEIRFYSGDAMLHLSESKFLEAFNDLKRIRYIE